MKLNAVMNSAGILPVNYKITIRMSRQKTSGSNLPRLVYSAKDSGDSFEEVNYGLRSLRFEETKEKGKEKEEKVALYPAFAEDYSL